MSQIELYSYDSKEDYFDYNSQVIQEEREEHESKENITYYLVKVQYYHYYKMYYFIIPKEYLDELDYLRENKMDIFAKGKILTFTSKSGYNSHFSFDAVIDSSEEDLDNPEIVYAYLVPIKEKYRYSRNLIGNYRVKERSGDLTYERMENALDEFVNGECCSENLEEYILGYDINYRRNFNHIFNYRRSYPLNIRNYFRINTYQANKIDRIFHKEMNTIKISSRTPQSIIGFIIYAIYQMRRSIYDKILVCSSSNSSADSIALELLKLKENVENLNLLRIYAKNQELIIRHKSLDEISYHKLIKKDYDRNNIFGGRNKLVEDNDIIISTCVNSYCDEIINYDFPFVIIVDANNSNENENLIPITLQAKHIVLIANEESDSGDDNLYKRMKYLYPGNHIEL